MPSITPLPTPVPQTSDPANFDARADAFLAALPNFATELNALGGALVLATNSTSTTSAAIGVAGGSLSMNLGIGKGYVPGSMVMIARTADATMGMLARVLTYNAVDGTGTQKIITPYGSGTYSAWTVSLALEPTNLGKQAIWVPARAWTPRTTNGAATGGIETSTNKVMLKSLDFDASTIEYAQYDLGTGKSWNAGTITAVPIWSHASTTTNFKVSWGMQAVALADGDNLDTAFGTAIYSNDTGGVTDKEYVGPETAAITASNTPLEGDRLILQCSRKADDATNDTLAIDARLHGWIIYITIDQGSDA